MIPSPFPSRLTSHWLVVVFGQPRPTSETEFEVLRAMDGRRTVADIAEQMQRASKVGYARETIRRLAERSSIDLPTQPLASGQVGRRLVGATRPLGTV